MKSINEAFGLSYASYLVIPRSVLEAMPPEWQDEFLTLVYALHEMLGSDWDRTYAVQARDASGRFVADPFANYRRPPEALRARRHPTTDR